MVARTYIYPLNYTTYSSPVPTTSPLVAADYSVCYLECCLHRTKRTAVVNTEKNTPESMMSGVLVRRMATPGTHERRNPTEQNTTRMSTTATSSRTV